MAEKPDKKATPKGATKQSTSWQKATLQGAGGTTTVQVTKKR